MRLGVGVVTYNRLDLIKKVIASLEKFTTCPFALVVADDGSTDGTAEYLEARRITCVRGPNRGIAWNKNRALYTLRHTSRADVIILLEDDTEPTELGWQFPWMRAASLHGYVTYAHPKVADGILAGAGSPEDPYACMKITSQCAAVTAEALDAVGYFDTRFKGYGVEDGEWTTRLRRCGFGIRRVPSPSGEIATNLMLDSGIRTLDSETYRDRDSIARNRDIMAQVKDDPVPRAAWIGEDEQRALEGEVQAALARCPLAERAPEAGRADYPYLPVIPREVARRLSLQAVGRPPAAAPGGSIAIGPRAGSDREVMREVLALLDQEPDATLSVDEGTPWMAVGLAALGRRRLDIRPGCPADRLGFRSWSEEAATGLLDFNFDLALDRFVPPAVSQASPWPGDRRYFDATFLEGGEIPLLISTLQPDPQKIGEVGNVGDNFGLHVVRHLAGAPVRPFGLWADQQQPMMLSVGSFIQHARDRGLVWGTGAVTAEPWKDNVQPTRSIFLGVRGPRTREHLLRRFGLAPPVVGDPGMLLPEVIPPEGRQADIEIGFILHGLDRQAFLERATPQFVVNNRSTPQALVADMLRCKAIITSSLHGWIFAHALGIPAAVIKVTDKIPGGEFKFIDYAQSVGIYEFAGRIDCTGSAPLPDAIWAPMIAAAPRPRSLATERLKATFPFPPRSTAPAARALRGWAGPVVSRNFQFLRSAGRLRRIAAEGPEPGHPILSNPPEWGGAITAMADEYVVFENVLVTHQGAVVEGESLFLEDLTFRRQPASSRRMTAEWPLRHLSGYEVASTAEGTILSAQGAPVRKAGTHFLLTTLPSKSFDHFVRDVLSRFYIFEKLPEELRQGAALLGHRHRDPARQQLLAAFAGDHRLETIPPGEIWQIERVVMPGNAVSATSVSVPAMRHLRQRMQQIAGAGNPPAERRPLYVPFPNPPAPDPRRLDNLPEVEALLEEFGFRRLESHALPLAEQFALLRETSIILGMHGMGMMKQLFLPEGGSAIEIGALPRTGTERGPRKPVTPSWSITLSHLLGLGGYYTLPEPRGEESVLDIPTLRDFLLYLREEGKLG